MKIISAQLFVYCEVDENLRRRLFELEGKLHDDFVTPFPIVRNVPDGANETLPRFETTSLNGNSDLKISPTFVQFVTSFTNDYQTDVQKIKDYYEKKIPILSSILENNNLTYHGFIIELEEEFEDEKKVLETLSGYFAEGVVNEKTIGVNLRYARLVNDHFCNVNVAKYTLVKGRIEKDENQMPVPIPEPEIYGLRTQLDINTRPKYQAGAKSTIPEILTLIQKTLNHAIEHNSEFYLSGSIDFEPIVDSRDGG